jgi:long-chain acyl-CoA synthetase
MLKKNSPFFNELNKFKNKNALITEENKCITYKKLLIYSKAISKKTGNKRSLIFLLGQNNIETIAAYISFINSGHVLVLLDYRINNIFLNKLINLYKPSYIFCEKFKLKTTKLYLRTHKFKSYFLFKRNKEIQIKVHKNLMLLMSTSGTTGSPKFVKLSYSNFKSNTKEIIKYLNINSKDITISSLPFTYVYGLSVINTHLSVGGTIVLTNSSMVEKKFWQLINKNKVNNFAGVPYNYSIIEKIAKTGLPLTLKYTTQAGGKMDHVLIKKILDVYKLNNIKLIQMYGASEATSRMSYLNPTYAYKKIGSIGKTIPNGNFYLIDKNRKVIKEKFKKGELVYKGKNVFMGYAENLNDLSLPDLNNGILETGDIAYQDNEGFYFIVGRKNRYTKIYGIRINLSELENILLKKGIISLMKESTENKINIYFKNLSEADKAITYITKMTSINQNVFVVKKILKKNLSNNLKFKI